MHARISIVKPCVPGNDMFGFTSARRSPFREDRPLSRETIEVSPRCHKTEGAHDTRIIIESAAAAVLKFAETGGWEDAHRDRMRLGPSLRRDVNLAGAVMGGSSDQK